MQHRQRLVYSAYAGILFFGMAITTLGSVLPQLKEKFQIDDVSAGAIFSILAFGILSGSLVFGPVADRYGYRIMLACTCLLMTAGFAGIALSPSFLLLKVSTFLFGLGGGAINGGTSALVSEVSEDNKGANLSMLGVFFAIGALGMPFLLAAVDGLISYIPILLATGAGSAIIGVIYLLMPFPAARHASGIPVKQALSLLKHPFLLLVSFFLFFQSAFEGIMNNWTTTYLTEELSMSSAQALYILSAVVVGMTVMRLLLASVMKGAGAATIWGVTFLLLFSGLAMIYFSTKFLPTLVAFSAVGAGLAAGFPIMLGYVGERFEHLSGTAFSIAFSIALTGNMILNYIMGIIAKAYGIRHMLTMSAFGFATMLLLCLLILRRIRSQQEISRRYD